MEKDKQTLNSDREPSQPQDVLMSVLAQKERQEVAQHQETVLGINQGNGTDCKDYSCKDDEVATRTPNSQRDVPELRSLQELDSNTIDRVTVRTGEGQKQTGGKWKRIVRQVGAGKEAGIMLSKDTLNSEGLKRR